MIKNLLYLLLGIASLGMQAQHQIRGKVMDFKTKDPLAFANINFNGDPELQVISDINGDFSMDSPNPISHLSCSYVGYVKVEMNVSTSADSKWMVSMMPEINNLNEVTIYPGKNPANRIIRSAVASRAINNPEHIASFQYQCYNKFWGNLKWNSTKAVDTIAWNNFIKGKHIFMMESVTKRKFLAPDYSDEVVIASKMSGFQNPVFASVATDMQPFAFYDDNIKLLNVHYLNPISKGSLKKYAYKLEEIINKGKDTIFVISFKPKAHKNFDGLKGVLYINSNRYAIQNVIASAYDKSTINLKIQQQYQWVNDQYWFPEQLNFALILGEFSNTKGVGSVIEGKSYISNITFNTSMQKKDFPLQSVRIAEDAIKKDSVFWNAARFQKLNPKELKTYVFLDSMGRKNNFDQKIKIFLKLADNKIPVSWFDIDLSKTMRFNEYEGVRLGTGLYTNEKFSEKLTIGGFLGYGQKDQQWKYGLETHYRISTKDEFTAGIRYQDNLTEAGGYGMRQYEGGIFNFRNYMAAQFDRIIQNSILINFRMLKYFKCQLSFNQTNSKPLYATEIIAMPARYKNTDASIFIRFAYKEKIIQLSDANYSSGTAYPIIYVDYSKGLKRVFRGELQYSKLEIAVEQTFFSKNIGRTHYRLEAGFINRDLPVGLLFTGEGSYHSDYPFTSKNNFQTMAPYEFISDQYTNMFLSHDFGTLLMKTKIFKPDLSFHNNAGWGTLAQKELPYKTGFKIKEKIFLETGLQLDNVIRLNVRNLGYLGLGAAAYYRYGYYAKPDFEDNMAYKITINFTIK